MLVRTDFVARLDCKLEKRWCYCYKLTCPNGEHDETGNTAFARSYFELKGGFDWCFLNF